jgi:hypothetical protein
MARAHFVKKAQKDNPVVKKGESYYWWSFRFGGKRYSTKPPRPSQLTQSEFLSQAYELQERIEDLAPADLDDLVSYVEEIGNEFRQLGEECSEKHDNMPEGLQDGDTGQLLEARAEKCVEIADELENGIDFSIDEDEISETIKEEKKEDPDLDVEERTEELKQEKLAELVEEVQGLDFDVDVM